GPGRRIWRQAPPAARWFVGLLGRWGLALVGPRGRDGPVERDLVVPGLEVGPARRGPAAGRAGPAAGRAVDRELPAAPGLPVDSRPQGGLEPDGVAAGEGVPVGRGQREATPVVRQGVLLQVHEVSPDGRKLPDVVRPARRPGIDLRERDVYRDDVGALKAPL